MAIDYSCLQAICFSLLCRAKLRSVVYMKYTSDNGQSKLFTVILKYVYYSQSTSCSAHSYNTHTHTHTGPSALHPSPIRRFSFHFHHFNVGRPTSKRDNIARLRPNQRPDDGGTKHPWNVGILQGNHMALHSTRPVFKLDVICSLYVIQVCVCVCVRARACARAYVRLGATRVCVLIWEQGSYDAGQVKFLWETSLNGQLSQ
jgi:hypothetical protein